MPSMSYRLRRSITALIIAVLAALGQTLWTQSGGEPQGERVIVSKVYDGDTVVVGRGWRKTTVRLIGASSTSTPCSCAGLGLHPPDP